jgi:hypothetical protein
MFGKFVLRRSVAARQRRWPMMVLFCCLPLASPSVLWAAASGGDTQDPLITTLKAKAEAAIAANRLTTPVVDNAVAYIEQMLTIEPQNQYAMDLLNRVSARYARLVDSELRRGERAAHKSLERATTFRDRAKRLISRYHLPDTALTRMDRAIASAPPDQDLTERERMQANTAVATGQILNELVKGHVTLAATFLDRHDLQEAKWHTAQAETLAVRYKLADPDLQELKQRLATQETGLKEHAEARRPLDEGTRRRLTELAAFYVVSGEVARGQGDLPKAVRHKHAAEEIIEQYGLPNARVQRLSAQLTSTIKKKAGFRPVRYRVFGNF